MQTHSTVFIDRPADDVFAFISNPENNPAWQGGMRECRITSEGPLGVGSTYEQVASFLGRRINSSFEIVGFELGQMIKGTTTAGSFPITFTRSTEAQSEGGTMVSALVEGEAVRFFRIAEPLLRRMVQRSIDKDYQKLKQLLEGSQGS